MNNNFNYPLPNDDEYPDIHEVEPIQKSQRKKGVAIALAFFFGGFGVHSFYLGFTKKGVLQFCSLFIGISTIWALIDMVRMIFSSELYDADGKAVE